MVEKTASRRNTVISTGGGTVKDPANMAALHAGGIIVCLKADIDTILARTEKHGTRPVLDQEDQATAVRPLHLCWYNGASFTKWRISISIRVRARRVKSSMRSSDKSGMRR
mgnify:CR=1 FL=1